MWRGGGGVPGAWFTAGGSTSSLGWRRSTIAAVYRRGGGGEARVNPSYDGRATSTDRAIPSVLTSNPTNIQRPTPPKHSLTTPSPPVYRAIPSVLTSNPTALQGPIPSAQPCHLLPSGGVTRLYTGGEGVVSLHIEYAERGKEDGIVFIVSLFCEHIHLEYVGIHVQLQGSTGRIQYSYACGCASGIRESVFNM